MHSDYTVEADTNPDVVPAMLKQPNLTLELFPNHSENLESAKKVPRCPCCVSTECSPLSHQAHSSSASPAAESSGEDKEIVDREVFPSAGPRDQGVCGVGGALRRHR